MILLTGSSGLLGSRAYPHLSRRWEVTGTALEETDQERFVRCDLTDREAAERLFRRVEPDAVLHAAAQKDIRACEEEPEACWELNVAVTRHLSRLADASGAFFVFVSSDYVFDGTEGRYAEDDPPSPALRYGETKARAEDAVRRVDGAVCRSSGLYAWGSREPTFVEFVVDRLRRGDETELWEDSFNSPTYVPNLCEMLEEVLRRDEGGVYHTAGPDRISRFGFGLEVARAFGLDGELLEPVPRPRDRTPPRPGDVSLDVTRTRARLDVPFLGVREGLRRLKEEHGL